MGQVCGNRYETSRCDLEWHFSKCFQMMFLLKHSRCFLPLLEQVIYVNSQSLSLRVWTWLWQKEACRGLSAPFSQLIKHFCKEFFWKHYKFVFIFVSLLVLSWFLKSSRVVFGFQSLLWFNKAFYSLLCLFSDLNLCTIYLCLCTLLFVFEEND